MIQETELDVGGRMIWVMAPLHKVLQRETPPFVVREIGCFQAQAHFYSKRAGREGCLLLYTIAGKGRLSYGEGQHELAAGSAVLIDCRRRHEYWTDEIGHWTFYWLYFSGEYADFFMRLLYGDAFSVLLLNDALTGPLEKIVKILPYSDPNSLLGIYDAVHRILMALAETATPGRPDRTRESSNRNTMKQAADYIRDNHWQPLIVEDVAKRFGLSKYYFLRLFKAFTGTTPYRYALLERTNQAKKLLKTTDLKVSEIGLMVGFSDVSNFIRIFRSISGTTPRGYRLNG